MIDIDYFINSDEKIKKAYSIEGYNNHKKDFEKSSVKVVMVSMSPMNDIVKETGTLGTSVLYNVLNQMDGVVCERSSFPEGKVLSLLRKFNLGLFSFESKKPVKDFDIIACSFYFSLQFVNFLPFLKLINFPFYSKNRDNSFPLIIAGGQACYNSECIADFVDVVMIGEGEEWMQELISLWPKIKGLSRKEQLIEISKIHGSYIPSFYSQVFEGDKLVRIDKLESSAPDRVKRRFVKSIEPYVLGGDDFINSRTRGTIEIARGCSYMCSFCQLAHTMKPRRCLNVDTAKKLVDSYVGRKSKIKLFAPEEGSYKDYLELGEYMVSKGFTINSCDCRLDCYSPDWGAMLIKGGADHISVGVEGFSQRQRDFLNKCVSREMLFSVCKDVFSRNLKEIKLFYISGLPDSDFDDIEEMYNDIGEILKMRNEMGSNIFLTLSITLINTQPFTPMQWFGAGSLELYENVLDSNKRLLDYSKRNKLKDEYWDKRTGVYKYIKLRREFGAFDAGVNMKARSTFITYILGRGDRRLCKVMIGLCNFNVVFDGMISKIRDKLYSLCQAFGVPFERFLSDWDVDDCLPWGLIDVDIGKDMNEYLKSEFKRMKLEVDSRRKGNKAIECLNKSFVFDDENIVLDNFNKEFKEARDKWNTD